MKISDKSAETIRKIGLFLLAIGAAVFLLALVDFSQLPNYARSASMLPALFGVPMAMVDNYRHSKTSGQAIAYAIIPFMALFAAIWWYLADPAAKA